MRSGHVLSNRNPARHKTVGLTCVTFNIAHNCIRPWLSEAGLTLYVIDIMSSTVYIHTTQKAALVPKLGGPIEIISNYPVQKPGEDEVLALVLYTGVCQSDLHTARGTAPGADGKPILNVKLTHVGGHEGVGRIIRIGPSSNPSLPEDKIGDLVGVRFLARVCHKCEFCRSGREQHCAKASNHLHHEDGSFQEYCVLDRKYLTRLPPDIDPVVIGPTLCAGLTAFKVFASSSSYQ